MMHLSEEELIEHYYSEHPQSGAAEHLKSCAECSAQFAALARDLDEFVAEAVPARDPNAGERVWLSLRPSLRVYEGKRRRWFQPNLRMGLGLAAAAAALIVVAFFAGRIWEQQRDAQVHSRPVPAAAPDPQRVILVVLTDHLDRSERLLVELNHPDEAAVDPELQTTARELLKANQLYRRGVAAAGSSAKTAQLEAIQSNDPALGMALDDLERVLTEVANTPGGLTRDEIARLEKQRNTGSLLFEVRVLRSHVGSQQTPAGPTRKGGTA
jgi:hypothetical protein